MPGGSMGATVASSIQSLFEVGSMAGLTDGELLDRFLEGNDAVAEAAFTSLAERHGPMVLRVCRATLNETDAHDAFQATFLVLVKSARRVRRRDSIGGWLHGVARRVAARSAADASRRRRREREAAMTSASKEAQPPRDPCPELHDEIARLPNRYREPIVLCYLEGQTTESAAALLGCPKGTILSRLSRARDQLRDRLTRRGVTVPAALAASGLVAEPASATPPAALLSSTVTAALAFSGRTALAPAASTSVAAFSLATGVLQAMTITKLTLLGATAAIGILALGGLYAADPSQTPKIETAADRIRRELQAAEARNQETQREIARLRSELDKLRPQADQPGLEGSKRENQENADAPAAGILSGLSGIFDGGPGEPRYELSARYGIIYWPHGEKIAIYNPASNQSRTIQLGGTAESPIEISPAWFGHPNEGYLPLQLSGKTAKRLAVFSLEDMKWYSKDIEAGGSMPLIPRQLGSAILYLVAGQAHAFSLVTKQWATLDLGENAGVIMTGSSEIQLQVGSIVHTFDPKATEWRQVDPRAVIDAAIAAESEQGKDQKPAANPPRP